MADESERLTEDTDLASCMGVGDGPTTPSVSEYVLALPLGAPCSACGITQPMTAAGRCAVCAGSLPDEAVVLVRSLAKERRRYFKGRLQRLQERMHSVTDPPLAFVSRGVPLSEEAHADAVLGPALQSLQQRHQSLVALFSSHKGWDPADAGCVEAFSALMTTLDDAVDSVGAFTGTLPPIGWRGVHRELGRASAASVCGQVLMAATIAAPDAVSAISLQSTAEAAFATAKTHAERTVSLMERARRHPGSAVFRADGALDFAAIAWSAGGQAPVTIAEAAGLVREALAEIPRVAELGEGPLLLLLPSLALGALAFDADLLIERVRVLRGLLDSAGTSWVTDPGLLVARAQTAIERIHREAERIGREESSAAARHHRMRTLSEAYRELVEGPLRDLGAPLLCAARYLRGDANAGYEADVADGVQAGDLATELSRMGPYFQGNPVGMLYRNASSHAGIEITATGVRASRRTIEQGRVVDRATEEVSDAEFTEDVVGLLELLVAMQLAVLPWMWTQPDQRIQGSQSAPRLTDEQRRVILELLAGLQGVAHVGATRTANAAMEVSVALPGGTPPGDGLRLLYLVPAAFGSDPDARSVTFSVKGLQSVTFSREEFADCGDLLDGRQAPVMAAGVPAKWISESGTPWVARDQATYVTFPLSSAHFAAAQFVLNNPEANGMAQAADFLHAVRLRMSVVPQAERSQLTSDALELMQRFERALRGWTLVKRRRQRPDRGRVFAAEVAATIPEMLVIQEAAKAIRGDG